MLTKADGWQSRAASALKCCSRRHVLKSLLAGAVGGELTLRAESVFAADVEWLAEVRRPPVKIPRENSGLLEPLLINADGRPIRTLPAWKTRRREIRRRWMTFLGPMPEQRPEVRLEILKQDRPQGCLRQLVRYESEPGLKVEGYLLRPDPPAKIAKRAGLVALHQTTRDTIQQIAGVTGPEAQQLGLKLSRRGFIVFCPRCYLWQGVSEYRQAVEKFTRRHPKTLGMHKMLYDASRGVDVLVSLPEVDQNRIGAVGHSLGAKETLYLAAFDERIKAAVASEGGLGFRSTNWDAPWYLGKAIQQPAFKLNHHQLLALIAPRPFLVLAGETGRGASDGDRSWPYIEVALPVYELYGRGVRLGLYNHHEGHTISPKTFRRLEEWLMVYLQA